MKKTSAKMASSTAANHFAFYHQNEALLFQFLLHESLRALQVLKRKPNEGYFLQLTGNLKNHPETWHAPVGHLPRLSHYCSLFTMHFSETSSWVGELGATLERAFVLAKKCQDLQNIDDQELAKEYTKLRKEIRVFTKLLLDKVCDFQNSPSVLFFLLRHQEQLDSIYREPMVKRTFLLLFPEGMKQAYNFLVDNFTKKGFDHLIPTVEKKLKQIE